MNSTQTDYNVTDAATFLHVSRTTFYKIISRYKLKPARKIGQMSMFSLEDLKRVKKEIAA